MEIRQDKANLLLYTPNRPHFKQNQKNDITQLWANGFFLIYYFLLFEEKRKKDITNI